MSQRLLCVLPHPTQYDPPLWACLTRRGILVPTVHYEISRTPADPEIAREITWAQKPGDGYELYPRTLGELCRELHRFQPRPAAVLTSGWTRASTWRVWLAAKRLGIPVILPSDKILLDDPRVGWHRSSVAVLHAIKNRFFDGFLTTGSLGLAALESEGVVRERVALGFYPVDIRFWETRVAALAAFSASLREWAGAGAFIVLAVSKLSERENPLLVLEAFARFERGRRSRLVFVGDGPLRPAVESRIRALAFGDRVRLPGYVRYDDLAGYYGAADVFVHVPRIGPWEISVSEAMACGVPVVSTPQVGAAWDLVIPGRTGAIAERDDPVGLSAALEAVAAMREGGDVSAAVKSRVVRVGVESAAAEMEALVDRLQRPLPAVPLLKAIRMALRPSGTMRPPTG